MLFMYHFVSYFSRDFRNKSLIFKDEKVFSLQTFLKAIHLGRSKILV